MSSDDTTRVLERHGAAAEANDLDAIMADYTEDAVLFSPRHGVLHGAEIRTFSSSPAI
jgi:ketosteroid isomerase-like protein